MRLLILSVAFASLVAVLAGRPAAAQSPAMAMNAQATVTSPITGAGIQYLSFGTLAPGATGDVLPGPSTGPTSSAGWRFSGVRKGRTFVWAMVLPPALLRGIYVVPINWNNAGYGTFCIAQPASPCVLSGTFNPATVGAVTYTIPNSTSGNNFDFTIYAGARTTIPSVPAGIYTAQVTVSMAYVF